VSAVLTLDGDRLAWNVVLDLVFEEELARHGC
jgi:hypothetical protein